MSKVDTNWTKMYSRRAELQRKNFNPISKASVKVVKSKGGI